MPPDQPRRAERAMLAWTADPMGLPMLVTLLLLAGALFGLAAIGAVHVGKMIALAL